MTCSSVHSHFTSCCQCRPLVHETDYIFPSYDKCAKYASQHHLRGHKATQGKVLEYTINHSSLQSIQIQITGCTYICVHILTFKNRASYIQDGCTATLQMLHFIYIFSTHIHTEYFKHAAHSMFFSSKCRLFRNATFFGSCVIHILHTGCAKI